MPLIVDTFNVLHQTGVLPPSLAGIDVAGLIELISRSRFRRRRARLVCDGTSTVPGDVGTGEHISIEFSGRGRSADDVIARHINRSSAPKRLTIVSSDREVQKAAKRRRCTVLRSDEFLRQLAMDVEREERRAATRDARRPKQFTQPLTQKDAVKWMRELGLDESAPLSPEQLEALERTVEKLLGERGETGSQERVEAPPELPRAEARKRRARERDRHQLEAEQRTDATTIPKNIIAEAERLWQREKGHDETR